MKLAIFDIDGTITRTGSSQMDFYFQVFQDEVGIDLSKIDWSRSVYSTDSGIMPWVFREILGRDPREDELARLAKAYVRGTKEFLAGCSVEDLAVPGAPQAIKRLQEDGWQVAIATGGWRNTAELKLDRVGIDFRGLAVAYADDALGRSQIIAKAVSRAERKIGDRGFKRVVYVGDAFWDVNAAGRLGYGFVGRAKGENKDKLSEYGARFVLADYGDYDQVKNYLEQATAPALHRASLD